MATALVAVIVVLSPVGAPAAAQGSSEVRWHEVIEAGGSVGIACRVDKKAGRFQIRSRYAVATDSEYRVRYQTWVWVNGRKMKLDRTEWLDSGSKGVMRTAKYARSAPRGGGFVWTIRIYLKGAGWLEYDLSKQQIRRC